MFHSVSPSFALDRAADVFLGEDRVVSRALDREVWDVGVVRHCGPGIDAVRLELAEQCGRNGEFYRDLVREIAQDDRAGVGRFVDFIESWVGDRVPVDTALGGAVFVLEAIGLVAYLHDDLPSGGVERRTERSDGCDIVSVVVADMLNAVAMTGLLTIEAQWATHLSALCRRFLLARVRPQGESRDAENAELELLVAGTMLAAGMTAGEAEPSGLRAAARRRLDCGPRGVPGRVGVRRRHADDAAIALRNRRVAGHGRER